MIERCAAALVQIIAAELLRPGPERGPLTAPLAGLRQHLAEVQTIWPHLRRAVGWTGSVLVARSPEAVAAKGLHSRVTMWPAVLEAAEICAAGRTWPLLPPPPAWLDLAAGQAAVLSRTFTAAHRAINHAPQAGDAESIGCFPDIPLDAALFLANAHLALRVLLAQKRPGPYRFLDVGCGGGVKVALAGEVFRQVAGLEYDAGYVQIARRTLDLMQVRRGEIIEANALTFDDYGDYDVIYFFQPMRTQDGLHALEDRIASQARPGTILIAPYPLFPPRAARLDCAAIAGAVYVRGLSPGVEQALAAETARMGPHLVNLTDRPAHKLGWLWPLARACEMNGIRPRYRGAGFNALL